MLNYFFLFIYYFYQLIYFNFILFPTSLSEDLWIKICSGIRGTAHYLRTECLIWVILVLTVTFHPSMVYEAKKIGKLRFFFGNWFFRQFKRIPKQRSECGTPKNAVNKTKFDDDSKFKIIFTTVSLILYRKYLSHWLLVLNLVDSS